MTTPGGVPNLPQGALTLDTLASKTQDMTVAGMRGRANDRVSSIFGSSTGGDVTSDLSPLGVITKIFSGFSSVVANADPADVQGPEDLPGLLLDFIEGLPVIGQFIDLVEAILGTYTGDDETLLTVQEIFAPIRAVVDAITAVAGGTGGIEDFFNSLPSLSDILGWFGLDPGGDETDLLGLIESFLTGDSPLDAFNLFNLIPSNLLGMIPYNIVGDATHENLLTNGGFEGAVSVQGNGVWSWDAVNGRTSPGCVSVTANGSEQRLLSNAFPVTVGDKLPHILYAQWSGLAYTGTPFRTRMVRLLNHNQVGVDNLNSPTGLSSSQAGFAYALNGADYVVPAGCDECCYEITINASCTAGTIKFDDGWVYKDNLLQIPWTEDLPEGLQDLLDGAQATLDTIFEGITGFSQIGTLLSDVIDALQAIPFLNVLGTGGPANIGDTVQATWDQWIGGLVGTVGTGAGLPDLFNIGQQISSWAGLGRDSFDILGIRNNQSLNTGFLPTTQSNIGLDKVALQGTAPTVPITQSTALTNYQRIEKASDYAVVSWQGYGVTSVTDCYINVYKMDTTSGVNTLVHASSNQIGLLSGGSTPQPVVYNIPSAIHVEPGEVYGVEIAIRGAGTHNVVGSATWLQDQPTYPRRYSSVRNSGTSAAPSSFTPTYGTNVGFVEFGVTSGDVALPHTPFIQTFNVAGTTPYPVPAWANRVQMPAVGGGGGGRLGGSWGVSGEGGDAGSWNYVEWVRGVDFSGSPILSVYIPPAAAGGTLSNGQVGANGGNVVVTLPATPGFSSKSVTGTGGEGGDALNAGGVDGQGNSPGNQTYDGIPYVGGPQQNTLGADGAAPGAGGAGGNWVSVQPGGAGGLGGAWARFKQ